MPTVGNLEALLGKAAEMHGRPYFVNLLHEFEDLGAVVDFDLGELLSVSKALDQGQNLTAKEQDQQKAVSHHGPGMNATLSKGRHHKHSEDGHERTSNSQHL